MRQAVVHVNLDPHRELSVDALRAAIRTLRAAGLAVVAGEHETRAEAVGEIELLYWGDDVDALRRVAIAACEAAVSLGDGARPRVTGVTFMSSGTKDDAIGVMTAFGLGDALREVTFEDEDFAVITLDCHRLRRAPDGKLQTALESALNREVRFVEA